MVSGNATQESIGMHAIANRLRVGLAVGQQSGSDPVLLLLGDQALDAVTDDIAKAVLPPLLKAIR